MSAKIYNLRCGFIAAVVKFEVLAAFPETTRDTFYQGWTVVLNTAAMKIFPLQLTWNGKGQCAQFPGGDYDLKSFEGAING